MKVLVGGHWSTIKGWTYWRSGRHDARAADLVTIKLKRPVSGHVFQIRTWSVPIGANLSALGHPLGNSISLTQGHVVWKGRRSGVPMLAVRLLGAEGGSGSPLVDNKGNVVGVLQLGLGGADAIGQHTAGLIMGINLPAWWPGARKQLCKAYPHGGIFGCGGAPTPLPDPTSPAPTPTPPTSWLPAGFNLWTGAGDYKAGTIGSQTGSCSRTYATSAGCWGVNIVSQYGCRDDAFVTVDILDQAGALVDTGIGEISALLPGQVMNAHGDTFATTAASFRVTEIDCFNL